MQRPYEVLFRVIEHGTKTFKLEKGNRTEIVSVDRLKTANLHLEDPVPVVEADLPGKKI